jgi:hypothetical protein
MARAARKTPRILPTEPAPISSLLCRRVFDRIAHDKRYVPRPSNAIGGPAFVAENACASRICPELLEVVKRTVRQYLRRSEQKQVHLRVASPDAPNLHREGAALPSSPRVEHLRHRSTGSQCADQMGTGIAMAEAQLNGVAQPVGQEDRSVATASRARCGTCNRS